MSVTTTRLAGADGIALHAELHGPADGPPVLLAHGGGQTRHAWRGTAGRLAARGWRAVAVDLRGHGASDWSPEGDYRTEAFAADLVAVAETLARAGGRKPVLVGASLGGLAGMLAEGERAPGTFAALVFVDVTPRLEPRGVEGIVSFMRAHLEEGFGSLEEAADAVARYLPHRGARPSSPEGLRKNLRLGSDGRWRWHWDPAFMDGEQRPAAAMDSERLERALARIRAPMLLVRGASSELVSPEGAEAFLRVAPGASYVDVARAGHMVAGDRNDAFTEAVLDFLAGLER